jgi:hypothetical protein
MPSTDPERRATMKLAAVSVAFILILGAGYLLFFR